MNSAHLLAHFERLADAPDAIARLRRFILDLAVRGKLVEQDPSDEPEPFPVSAAGSKRERPRSLANNEAPTEPPYTLPKTWRWVRIGDQLELLNGMAFKPSDWVPSGIRIVRIQNLNRPEAPFNYCEPKRAREQSLIDDGAFLISWSGTPGTSFGAFIWDRGPAVLNQHIFRCVFKTSAFSAEYLRLAINGRLDEMIENAHGGVGLQHITKGKLEAMLIGLPPLAEQQRIVAKVDELMALCDRLEAARNERESRRDRLVAASLHRLGQPSDEDGDETFRADARFYLNHLPRLTIRSDHVKQLRQTILNLAVRGRLVPQDPNDEPTAAISDLADAEVTENLPGNWRYVRLEALLSENTRNGYSRRPDDAEHGVPILRISAGTVRQDGLVAEEEHKLISGIDETIRRQYGLERGDLLACRFNGNKFFVGRLTLFADTLGLNPIYPDKLIRVRLNRRVAQPEFIRMAGDADIVRRSIEELCATTVGNWGISAANLKEVRFPLPPLAEQHRIVARVNELMVVCGRLEASLAETESDGRRLLEAVLHEALEPAGSALEAAE